MTQFMPQFPNVGTGERAAEGPPAPPHNPQGERTQPDLVLGDDGEYHEELLGHNSQYYEEQFGLNIREASQTVSYNGQDASLAEVLVKHEECPLGGWVRKAYAEGGRDAVAKKFALMGQLSADFVVVLEKPADEAPKSIAPDVDKNPKKKLNP